MATLVTEKRHRSIVQALAWSPDGAVIASGASERGVFFWDPVIGNVVKTYRGLRDFTEALWWSPDSLHIAAVDYSGMFQVWNWKSDELVFEHAFPRGTRPHAWAAWSPDGGYIATTNFETRVTIWDAKTWQPVQDYVVHSVPNGGPGRFCWSPDGSRIASFGSAVCLWESDSGKELWQSSALAVDIAWSPDGTWLAVGEWRRDHGQVTIWNTETLEPLHTLRAYYMDPFVQVAWCSSNSLLAVMTPANRITIFDPLAGRLISYFHVFWGGGPIWSADGSMIACGVGRSRVQVWRPDLPAQFNLSGNQDAASPHL